MEKRRSFFDRVWPTGHAGSGPIVTLPRPSGIVLARHVPSLAIPDSAFTLEQIEAECLRQGKRPTLTFGEFLGHCWTIIVFLDGLEHRIDAAGCARRIAVESSSEFDAADLCAKLSPILRSAAIVASDFPRGISGVALLHARQDFANRIIEHGNPSRIDPIEFLKPGWKERISPFGYDLGWIATSLGRSLTFILFKQSHAWLAATHDNEILKTIYSTTFEAGGRIGRSHTEVTLLACFNAMTIAVNRKGKHFFASLKSMADQEAMRNGFRELLDHGLEGRLPCVDGDGYVRMSTGIQHERLEYKRRLHRKRKGKHAKQRGKPTATIEHLENADGPSPPKFFYWGGSRQIVPGKRWQMLNILWTRRNISDSELGSALWGEEWDESKLSTTTNRLNNDLFKTPWRITRSDGSCTLAKNH